MDINTAKKLLKNVSGASFVGIDTLTNVPLKGGKKNPLQGKVQKRVTGSSVMVFQNKNINGYDAMVKRRLESEGKDPNNFKLSPRAWGNRIENTPFIEHEKDGEMKYYLEVIFLKAGTSEYLLDGKVVSKDEIDGLPESREGGQGGLDDKVIVRSYKLESIVKLRIDQTEYTF